jgi:hypothetical protein
MSEKKYGMFSRLKKKTKRGYNDDDKAKFRSGVKGTTSNEEAMDMQEQAQDKRDGKSSSWFKDGGVAKKDCGMFSKLKKRIMGKKK